ncbi:MAG: hypothetical protein IKU40_05170 [Clostridia bacterium]|nr:hypothetical protein [Clostridia bacterium]
MNNNLLYNKEEIRVIGVDAGGTKTRAAAFDGAGNLLAEAFGGCGHVILSYDTAKSSILSALRGVWSDSCEFIAVGAAGASSAELSGRLSEELTAELGIRTAVMSDAELALNAAFGPEADGMLVISGTGSVVFLRQNGTILRAGGWGHILGDGGSAYYTAMTALRTITDLRDRTEPDEILERAVFDALDVDSIAGLVKYVYAPERSKADIAKLAPVIDRLAENGSANAEEILWKSADALSDDAAAVLRRSGMDSVNIALTGGHITHSDTLRLNFEQTLRIKTGKTCRLHFLPDEPDPAYAAYRIHNHT